MVYITSEKIPSAINWPFSHNIFLPPILSMTALKWYIFIKFIIQFTVHCKNHKHITNTIPGSEPMVLSRRQLNNNDLSRKMNFKPCKLSAIHFMEELMCFLVNCKLTILRLESHLKRWPHNFEQLGCFLHNLKNRYLYSRGSSLTLTFSLPHTVPYILYWLIRASGTQVRGVISSFYSAFCD